MILFVSCLFPHGVVNLVEYFECDFKYHVNVHEQEFHIFSGLKFTEKKMIWFERKRFEKDKRHILNSMHSNI